MNSDVDWQSKASYSAANNSHKLALCSRRTPFCDGIGNLSPKSGTTQIANRGRQVGQDPDK